MGNRRERFNIDYFTLAIMYLLALVSLFVIADATRPLLPAGAALHYVKRQMLWIVAGTITLVVVAWIDYEKFKKLSPYIYGLSIILLAVVLVHGQTALGAARWIQVGPFQLQPSEFAKAAIIIALAVHLDKKKSLTRWKDLISPLLLVGVPMLMILKQPDLGTTLVFVAITVGMLYMAGVPWTKMLIFPAGFALIVLWVYLHLTFHNIHLPFVTLHSIPLPMHQYQLKRLLVFLNPNKDPLGGGYNVIQSRINVGVGGMFGRGLSATHSNLLGFLPASYTDFIFAPLAEMLGFAGTATILFLYLVLLARGTYIAYQAKDRFGTLLASGVVAMFAFHVIESAGMATGMMPVAGVPLPFVSYGGSAFLTDSACVGILINVYGRRKTKKYKPAVAKTVPVLYSDELPESDVIGGPAES